MHSGDAAREALKTFRDPDAGVRVLCLPEPVDPATRIALKRALDPMGRNDLLMIKYTTPRAMVEEILKFAGHRVGPRRLSGSRRTTRSFLAQPTMVEATVDVGYWSRYTAVAAAAGVACMTGMSVFWAMKSGPVDSSKPSTAPAAIAEQMSAPRSPLVDDAALSAIATPAELEIPAERTRPIVEQEHVPEEEPATLEAIELPPPPIESVVQGRSLARRVPAAAIARGGAPGL